MIRAGRGSDVILFNRGDGNDTVAGRFGVGSSVSAVVLMVTRSFELAAAFLIGANVAAIVATEPISPAAPRRRTCCWRSWASM